MTPCLGGDKLPARCVYDAPGFFMPMPFFLVGPTAVGKTSLAVKLAERCDAEIVSADAFQIYGGFDLLTAKPTAEEQARVLHHMLGCVAPDRPYNVAQYLEDAHACIERIHRRGKRVIIAGGNGLYVKALTHGLSPLPPAQPEIRSELEQLSNSELFARLRALDVIAARTIDAQNKRRLVRALEVCLFTGKPFSSFQTQWTATAVLSPSCGVFLSRDRDDLFARINQRVEMMFAQGVVEEVQTQTKKPLSITAERILGLSDICAFINGQSDLEDCRGRIKLATRQYAKRQVTWFKREACFRAINLTGQRDDEMLDRLQGIFSLNVLP